MPDNDPRSGPEPATRDTSLADGQSGDPACWLSRVCPECGLFIEAELPAVCGRCGASVPADHEAT